MLRHLASSSYFCQLLDTVCAAVVLAAALLLPRSLQWLRPLESAVRRLADRPPLAMAVLFVGTICLRLCLLPLMPAPHPSVHDEFSYLLAARTFALGRWANGLHPLWPHFESVHIMQQPTYMSMYPPGQGALLCLGLLLSNTAWAGVLLEAALLVAILFWSMKGWMPPAWAFAGSLVALVRPVLPSYWTNSFWGGALPAIGGALLFGSIPRLAVRPAWRSALPLGLGLAVLALTRPYEGAVAAGATAVAIALMLRGRGRELSNLVRPPVILAAAAPLAMVLGFLLVYNSKLTGDALVTPYLQNRDRYASAPLFLWQKPRVEPRFQSSSLQAVYKDELMLYRLGRKGYGVPEALRKLKNAFIFFLGPLLALAPILLLVLQRRHRKTEPGAIQRDAPWTARLFRYAALLVAAGLAASLQVVWLYPHYLAPVFAPIAALAPASLNMIRSWRWRDRPSGLFLSRAIPLGCALTACWPFAAHAVNTRVSYWPLQWAMGTPAEVQPDWLRQQLVRTGGRTLVLVQYGPHHDPGYEWVYNGPCIDAAALVWARPTNPASDAQLLSYFSDRTIYLLNPDQHPYRWRMLRGPLTASTAMPSAEDCGAR